MEQYSRSRPPPPSSSPSPWNNTLPYNALSEEGSYGSFSLYAPSPLPSPIHLSASTYPAKEPFGLPFPSRHDHTFSENRGFPLRHLSRSISSTEGLRRHRRPLSELLSTPEGPPSPAPASAHRRPSLSSLMAGSLDFDRSPRLDEDMHLLQSHTGHHSATFTAPPFLYASGGLHYNSRASHYGFLSRASSDRFDLDPMIRSSFNQHADNYAHLTPPLPPYHSKGSSRGGEPAMVSDHEIGGANFRDNLINEHSYKKIQYLRSRSNVKSQDVNAPLSPLRHSLDSARKVKQTNNSLYDVNVPNRATMRDTQAAADLELQQGVNNPSMPLHHPQQLPFKDPPFDKKVASRFSFEHYNGHGVPANFDHHYREKNVDDENHQFGIQDPPLYVDSYGAPAQTHSPDQNIAFAREPASQEQHYKGRPRLYGHDQRKVLKNLNSQEEVHSAEVLVSNKNTYYDPVREAKPRFEMNWSTPNKGMASHVTNDLKAPVKPLNEIKASSASSDSHYADNLDMGGYPKAKQHTEKWMREPVLTKGQSILDNVTENILRKMIVLSYKYTDQSLPEQDISSAKLLFKRALLVQIQALVPKFTEISANEKKLAAHTWALQGSSIMNVNKKAQLSHQGLCLLHFQKILYDTGTSTFDILMKMRANLYELLIKPSIRNESSGQLRIACVGGAPGCVAIALRLFFVLVRPSCEVEVDIVGADEQSKEIVEELSLRDIKCKGNKESGIEMVKRNPSMMRYYKMLMLVNCMQEEAGKQQWRSMWDSLYENAGAGAVVVVYESSSSSSSVACKWEETAPSVSPWQFASLPRLDCVRIGRKTVI